QQRTKPGSERSHPVVKDTHQDLNRRREKASCQQFPSSESNKQNCAGQCELGLEDQASESNACNEVFPVSQREEEKSETCQRNGRRLSPGKQMKERRIGRR